MQIAARADGYMDPAILVKMPKVVRWIQISWLLYLNLYNGFYLHMNLLFLPIEYCSVGKKKTQ